MDGHIVIARTLIVGGIWHICTTLRARNMEARRRHLHILGTESTRRSKADGHQSRARGRRYVIHHQQSSRKYLMLACQIIDVVVNAEMLATSGEA